MRRVFSLLCIVLLVAGCSGAPVTTAPTPVASPPPLPTPTPTPAPAGPPTVTVTATGLVPLEITISVGAKVNFINNDTRSHDFVGGVDPAHPDCPEITMAGFLTPGQSRETGVFTTARACDYHDHTALGVPAFQGRIVIR